MESGDGMSAVEEGNPKEGMACVDQGRIRLWSTIRTTNLLPPLEVEADICNEKISTTRAKTAILNRW